MNIFNRIQPARAEWAVGLVTALIALSLGTVLARQYPHYFSDALQAPKHVDPDERLSGVSGYPWNSHSKTLVVALRVGCPYCEASMDFYEKLHKIEHTQGGAHLIAVFAERDAARSALPESLRDMEIFTAVDFTGLGVSATPTVILADDKAVVQKVWRGRLSDALEKQVFSAMGVQDSLSVP